MHMGPTSPKTIGATSANGPDRLFFLIRRGDYIQYASGQGHGNIPERYGYIPYTKEYEDKIIEIWDTRLKEGIAEQEAEGRVGKYHPLAARSGIEESFYPYVMGAIETRQLPVNFPCYPLPFPRNRGGATGPTDWRLDGVQFTSSGRPYIKQN